VFTQAKFPWASIFATKISHEPLVGIILKVGGTTKGPILKDVLSLYQPATYTFESASAATASAYSFPMPPNGFTHTKLPFPSSFKTKESLRVPFRGPPPGTGLAFTPPGPGSKSVVLSNSPAT